MRKIHIYIEDISCSGGTERVASLLANKLIEYNFDVTIVSLFGEKDQSYYMLANDVKIKYIGSASPVSMLKFVRKNSCDTLISISMGRLSFKLSMLNAIFNFPFKLILSEHVAYEASSFLVRLLKLVSYQFSDYLILLTHHDFNILHDKVRAKTVVIPNSSTFEPVTVDMLSSKQKIILAVGRLTYQKSFDRLLRIWASIKNKNGWQLKIVGDGEDKECLIELIEELNIADSAILIPASKLIDQEYRSASILAMTSRYEGLPLVLIESKSFGLPAIAYDCKTGPGELVKDFSDGFLIPENDSEAFKAKLEKLMNDDELRTIMQRNSLRASHNFSADIIIKEWLKLL